MQIKFSGKKLTITVDYVIDGQSLYHVQEIKNVDIILSKDSSSNRIWAQLAKFSLP